MDVRADDKLVEKRDKSINEPVQFYTARAHQPYELVVNEVKPVLQQVPPQHVGPPHQFERRGQVFPLRFFRLLDECPDPFQSFPLRRSE